MRPVSPAVLAWYYQKSMTEICENHYDTTAQNHCAHFVSHVLGLQLGMLCGDLTGKRHTGASVRCNELYNRLLDRGPWKRRRKPRTGCWCS